MKEAPPAPAAPKPEIAPSIRAMMRAARDMLAHEDSLFSALDMKPVLIGPGRISMSVLLPDPFYDGAGFAHTGLLTIILDSIFGMTVFTTLEAFKPIATVNLRTDYIGPARIGARLLCECEADGMRGDIAYVRGRLLNESDRALIATGAGAFMIGTRRPQTEQSS